MLLLIYRKVYTLKVKKLNKDFYKYIIKVKLNLTRLYILKLRRIIVYIYNKYTLSPKGYSTTRLSNWGNSADGNYSRIRINRSLHATMLALLNVCSLESLLAIQCPASQQIQTWPAENNPDLGRDLLPYSDPSYIQAFGILQSSRQNSKKSNWKGPIRIVYVRVKPLFKSPSGFLHFWPIEELMMFLKRKRFGEVFAMSTTGQNQEIGSWLDDASSQRCWQNQGSMAWLTFADNWWTVSSIQVDSWSMTSFSIHCITSNSCSRLVTNAL